jgi:hypothetical protein
MDFRILGENIEEHITNLKNSGVEILTKSGGGREHLLEPNYVLSVFPQWKPLIEKHGGALQVIVCLKDVQFSVCPWEFQIVF